jgi:hypothetical protein
MQYGLRHGSHQRRPQGTHSTRSHDDRVALEALGAREKLHRRFAEGDLSCEWHIRGFEQGLGAL